MAKPVYGLSQSLDGYVDHTHTEMRPGPALFQHFIEHVRGLAGCVYGRRTYEIMRYWDEDQADWDAGDRDFAAVWRSLPKWVVSRSLQSVGPNATLIHLISVAYDRTKGFFIDQVGLLFTARWVIGDVQPHLNDVGNDQSVLVYGTSED